MSEVYIVPGRRCPCVCDGNGTLVYIACPACGRVVIVCDEIGNIFDNLKNPLESSPLVIWRSAAQTCPDCRSQPLANFAIAEESQLLAAGVPVHEFAVAPTGMPFSLHTLTSA